MKKLSLFIGLSFLLCACEEHDLGVSNEVLYQKAFEQKYGPIAENHKWGFDKAQEDMLSQINLTRAVYKAEEILIQPDKRADQVFGKAAEISLREHEEVLAWFTNHIVYWNNTPTYYTGEPTTEARANTAFVRNSDYSAAGYGSLTTPEYGNPLGDYLMNAQIDFSHAWIQHVAANFNEEDVIYVTPQGQEIPSGTNGMPKVKKASKMDYLCCWSEEVVNGKEKGFNTDHIKDFNSGDGYGYEHVVANQNGELVTYSQIDRWSYGASDGSGFPHDKYFIVYLKGDGYEGWYLGFDYESLGSNTNERIKADGICNDWIIKITDVGNTQENFPVRVMCEDLGSTFDDDFNDVVFDIDFDATSHVCTVKIQAAGGTMPIRLQYGDKPLRNNNNVEEIHALFSVNVSQPVNVNSSVGEDGKTPISFTIAFSGAAEGAGSIKVPTESEPDLNKFNVYRRSESDPAVWYSSETSEGRAPYKIAVPVSTNWMKEMITITEGYPKFAEYVSNPNIKYWNIDIRPGNLYRQTVQQGQ